MQPSKCGESGRLQSHGQRSKTDLVEEQGEELKEPEGMKNESQLIKYPQHDQRMRGWRKKKG